MNNTLIQLNQFLIVDAHEIIVRCDLIQSIIFNQFKFFAVWANYILYTYRKRFRTINEKRILNWRKSGMISSKYYYRFIKINRHSIYFVENLTLTIVLIKYVAQLFIIFDFNGN